jgi:uncharacterized protein YbcI
MAEQIARVVTAFQQRRTGHEPKSVSVVLGGDTPVVTLHSALSPAEQLMSQGQGGAARVQEFHCQLFQIASESIREDIKRITTMDVRGAAVEVDLASGAVVHVFSSGTMVQVFLLPGKVPTGSFDAVNESEDEASRRPEPPSG